MLHSKLSNNPFGEHNDKIGAYTYILVVVLGSPGGRPVRLLWEHSNHVILQLHSSGNVSKAERNRSNLVQNRVPHNGIKR